MNGDEKAILILIGFPMIVGGMATLITWLSRRLSSTECPFCLRRIPKDTFKYCVPCPECGTEFSETNTLDDIVDSTSSCAQCASSIDCIPLWDGKSYCSSCLEKQSPGLLQAAGPNQLGEAMPYSISVVAWRMFLFAFAAIGGFAMFIAVSVAIAGDWQMALQGFAIFLLIGSPFIILWTCGGAAAMPLMRLKVMAWNRQLIIRIGTRLIVVPLADCKWREGKLSQMTLWSYAFLLRGSVLIVKLPKEKSKDGFLVAVGYTNETREIWKSFFEIAEVPQSR